MCASDGVSYENTCVFEYEQCVRRLAEGVDYVMVTILHLGECQETSEVVSSSSVAPEITTSAETTRATSSSSSASSMAPETTADAETTLTTSKEHPPVETEASCHSACIELWDPVCASDGATYGNTCFFEYEQCVRRLAEGAEYVEAAVLYLGECREYTSCGGFVGNTCQSDMECIDDWRDDCDPSVGDADCMGICEFFSCGVFSVDGPTVCPEGFACVDDPRDMCDPENFGADCPGICQIAPEIVVEPIEEPTGVEDGEVEVDGPEESEVSCNEQCAEIYDPVCASNGKTYENVCVFGYRQCLRRSKEGDSYVELLVLHKGECAGEEPVDSEDGSAEGSVVEEPDLPTEGADPDEPVVHESGESEEVVETDEPEVCNDQCIEIYDPVCGSDGETYENTCAFDYRQCVRRSKEGDAYVEVQVLHRGECAGVEEPVESGVDGDDSVVEEPEEPDDSDEISVPDSEEIDCNIQKCGDELEPVCGVDDATYRNRCTAKCIEHVEVAHEGECVKEDLVSCGGFAGTVCATGLVCVDDPRDDCDPEIGGADCIGLCVNSEVEALDGTTAKAAGSVETGAGAGSAMLGLPAGTLIAILIAVGVLVFAAVAGTVFAFRRRSKAKSFEGEEGDDDDVVLAVDVVECHRV